MRAAVNFQSMLSFLQAYITKKKFQPVEKRISSSTEVSRKE